MEEDYRHPEMEHSSGLPMELDVYVEKLKLAFEYQGKQHYTPVYWMGRDFAAQKRRDKEKQEACEAVTQIQHSC